MSDTLRIADEPAAGVRYPTPHRWSTAEYHQLAAGGFFGPQRVELIEGTVIDMSPMGRPHWISCQVAADMLRSVFGSGYFITTNLPAYLSELSEPEPDVAVLPGAPRDYGTGGADATTPGAGSSGDVSGIRPHHQVQSLRTLRSTRILDHQSLEA